MTKPHYSSQSVALHHGDCLDVLRALPDNSVDSVVTDPPYGLEFMGKDWDAPWKAEGKHWREASRLPGSHSTNPTPRPQNFGTAGLPFQQWCELWTAECLRVLKPGGHLLAFGGTRTWHRLACAVEDAGFEVRDSIAWLYGSGFPKSLDVSKAIDKAAGAERVAAGPNPWAGRRSVSLDGRGGTVAVEGGDFGPTPDMLTAPATPAAERWQGWGTALKPAFEPVVVARKPLIGTVAGNVLAHGTGALNIDACRIYATDKTPPPRAGYVRGETAAYAQDAYTRERFATTGEDKHPSGRWPANVVLDEDMAGVLDQQSGTSKSPAPYMQQTKVTGEVYGLGSLNNKAGKVSTHHGDSGGASRFFYVAKAPKSERPNVDGTAHPTVKPLTLMRWLVRLVTPPGGTVLEPFAGSGTTVEACLLEGFRCIAIEKTPEYLPLILARIERANTARLADEVKRTPDPDVAILEQLDLLDYGREDIA